MARVTRNSLLSGISGKLGSIVVRQVGNQTIVQAAEGPGPRAPRSPDQQQHLGNFHQAVCYAKVQMQDPAAKARYATGVDKSCRSPYTVAVRDYLHGPAITNLDASRYHGRPDDPIYITATDNFAVAAVLVSLYDPANALLETGPAALQPDGHWRYLTQTAQFALTGLRIEAEARDYPGNVAHHTEML